MRQARVQDWSVAEDEPHEVGSERLRLRVVDLEHEVGVAHDDLRARGAQLLKQIDAVEVHHCAPADEPCNAANLVDQDGVKALPVHVVQRLE